MFPYENIAIRKVNKFLPQNILKLLYETLIKPYLTYGIEAWYCAPNFLTYKSFIVHKKSIRAIQKIRI